jgi:hypothetical protein
MASLAGALYRFAGVSAAPLVIGTIVIGLALGLALPPARPAPRRGLPSRGVAA